MRLGGESVIATIGGKIRIEIEQDADDYIKRRIHVKFAFSWPFYRFFYR